VRVGALDLYLPAMLKPAALRLWRELAALIGKPMPPPELAMPPVLSARKGAPPPGYRLLGNQWLRIDIADKLLREAHGARAQAGRRPFRLDPAKAVSSGLSTASYARLLRLAGFVPSVPRALAPGAAGPPAPLTWRWRPHRARPARAPPLQSPAAGSAFAALAELVQ
jgi:ATP-dependent RNA helicase SUPV3L1/SUV3